MSTVEDENISNGSVGAFLSFLFRILDTLWQFPLESVTGLPASPPEWPSKSLTYDLAASVVISGGASSMGIVGSSPSPRVIRSLELFLRTDFKPDVQICGNDVAFDTRHAKLGDDEGFRENRKKNGSACARPGEVRSRLDFQKCMMAA